MENKECLQEELLKIKEQKSVVQSENNKLKNSMKDYRMAIADKPWWPYMDVMFYDKMIKGFLHTNRKIVRAYNKMEKLLEEKMTT